MRKINCTIILVFYISNTYAQSVGIGGIVNHMSYGALFNWSPTKPNALVKIDFGLRYMINHYTEDGTNEQEYAYYKQGYADGFFEHLGLNITPGLRIWRYHFVELGLMSNFQVAFYGMKRHTITDYYDYDLNKRVTFPDVVAYKASPSIEWVLGPKLALHFTKKLSLEASSGFGVLYMHHSASGRSIYSGARYSWIQNGLFGDRGIIEYVGFDRLPSTQFVLRYSL